jgi:hypothetical protein
MGCERNEQTGKGESLSELVDEYIREYRSDGQAEFRRYASCDSLREAVVRATLALTAADRRHPHQYRFQLRTLEASRDALARRELQVASARTFAELHDLIEDATQQIRGVGPLYVYDVATRIGAKRELWPEEIYLHAGTRKEQRGLAATARGRYLRSLSCEEYLERRLIGYNPR